MKEREIEILKAFAAFLLPDGVLDYFELVEFTVNEDPDGVYLSSQSIHLYLDERDNRSDKEK